MVSQDPCINCFCHFCGTPLRFQISRVGETVNCFNCAMETVLFIPGLEAPYPEERYRVEVREIQWQTSDLGLRYLTGIVTSKTPRILAWVRIEFILYNEQGLPVGSTSECQTDLAGYESWKFRTPISQNDAVKASCPLISCEYGRIVGCRIPPVVRPPSPVKAPAAH